MAKVPTKSRRSSGTVSRGAKRASKPAGKLASKAGATKVKRAGKAERGTIAAARAAITDPSIGVLFPLPIFQDHISNLFERARPGRPVVRADDLVALRLEMRGLEVVPGAEPRLRKTGTGAAQLILHYPPQSFAEETFFEQPADPNQSELLRPPPIRARIAHESRLAFSVPDGFDIAYTLESVLAACRDLPLRVTPAAKPRQIKLRPLLFGQLVSRDLVNALPLKRRAAMASAAASTIRIGVASGDMATVRARQLSIGAGFDMTAKLPGDIALTPGVRLAPAKPEQPNATTTSIEMPWRLILSPHSGGRWRHATGAVTSAASGRTELWHSRLVVPRADGSEVQPPYPDPGRTTRAVWALSGMGSEAMQPPMQSDWPDSTGLPPTAEQNPFRTTLSNFDRYQIPHLSANFSVNGYAPEPLDTNLMMLTALGGWLDSRGAWDPPGLNVEEWVHRATMGRDHYVRVVYRGFLFPFGHRVVLIKVSERKFHNGNATHEQSPGNTAYLRQRFFIGIREKECTYDEDSYLNAQAASGIKLARKFPFSRIKLLTETTPTIDKPENSHIDNLGQLMFWPNVGGRPFRFQCAGTDLDGRRVLFDLPMIFVDNTLAAPRTLNPVTKKLDPQFSVAENAAAKAVQAYRTAPSSSNTAALDWQRVALAPSLKPGDTTVQVDQMEFGGFAEAGNQSLRASSERLTRPVWVPVMEEAKARIGPIAHLSGNQGAHALAFNQQFLRAGFDPAPTANRGEVFVDVLPGSGPNLDFSSQGDKSGGFLQPNLKPAALSRLAGPVMSDPAQFIAGKMPKGAGFPTSISDLPLPLLFGTIPLGQVIEMVADLADTPDKVPKFVSESGTQVESFISGLVGLFELVTDIASQPASIADAAMTAFKATLADLVAQAQAYAAAQMQPVLTAIDTLRDRIEDVADKLTAMIEKTVDQAAGLPELTSLPAAIAAARSAAQDLRDAANAAPGGVSLPAGFRQGLLNAAQKIDALLAGLEQLQALVAAGKALWDALDAIVGDPDGLADLLGDPAGLRARVETLADAIGDFRTALEAFDILDGAPRNAVLAALGTVEDILNAADDLLRLIEMLTGDELTIRFDWNPEITNWSLTGSTDPGDALFRANDKRGLMVAVVAEVKKNGSTSPSIGVTCGLKHFDLVLIAPDSFLELNFEKIEFTVDSAAKMDVDVLLSDIKFVGPLSFVETLRDLIPLDGFSDPPYLDITPQGIDAGFDVSLPSITCGVLNISNISLGAGFTVPFIGQPLSVRFNFCRRDQPFLLTVYIFGGGGFFGVTIDPGGVQILEASFEFGAAFSIDFGVASGGVHVMAGIYYRMEGDNASLTGYFRLGGHVDVLGLITASIELYLELRYEPSSGKCVGKAELTIEISLFIFSGSVTITCERKFAGSNGDPSLRQMLGFAPQFPLADELQQIDEAAQYAWRDHLEAFA